MVLGGHVGSPPVPTNGQNSRTVQCFLEMLDKTFDFYPELLARMPSSFDPVQLAVSLEESMGSEGLNNLLLGYVTAMCYDVSCFDKRTGVQIFP